MSEINEATENSVLQNIEELGGIPVIDLEVSVSGMTAYPTDKTLSIADMAADAAVVGDQLADVQAAIADAHPVGSIFMTTSSSNPYEQGLYGVWEEIAITASWNDLKTGKRDYEALAEGQTGGAVHFWLRTA